MSPLEDDLMQLKSNPTPQVKKQITEKITFYLDCNAFNEQENSIALDIIEMIVKEADKELKMIVSKNLKSYPKLKKKTALLLANDKEDEIAIPILGFSTVLSEEDIINIVESTQKINRLIAVTKRPDITEKISDKLIKKNNEQITVSLLQNQKAQISENNLNKIAGDFKDSKSMLEVLVDRGGLSPVVIERLVTMVSDELKRKLVRDYNLPSEVASDIATSSKEEVLTKKLSIINDRSKTKELINHLHASGKLTHSLILRALCKGEVVFFAMALGKLAKIPEEFAENMVLKEGVTSFASLYKTADMPKGSFEAVNILLRIALGIIEKSPDITQKEFSNELAQKIIEGEYDKKINMMNHFLLMITNV